MSIQENLFLPFCVLPATSAGQTRASESRTAAQVHSTQADKEWTVDSDAALAVVAHNRGHDKEQDRCQRGYSVQ